MARADRPAIGRNADRWSRERFLSTSKAIENLAVSAKDQVQRERWLKVDSSCRATQWPGRELSPRYADFQSGLWGDLSARGRTQGHLKLLVD